jgi:hypothetical protein
VSESEVESGTVQRLLLGTSTVFMLFIDVSILMDPVLSYRCRRACGTQLSMPARMWYSVIDAGAQCVRTNVRTIVRGVVVVEQQHIFDGQTVVDAAPFLVVVVTNSNSFISSTLFFHS